jgi:SPP1 family phage portal protein
MPSGCEVHMEKMRTSLDILSPADIMEYIKEYERTAVPWYDKLWAYYLGKNTKILSKQPSDPNNPDNRTPVSYGRKIITTFAGYAYRPRYITYKCDNEAYLNELQTTFDENNEHIKTSLDGRNTGIFGLSYELLYIDKSMLTGKPEVKFALIDPREMIVLYDYSIEPKLKCAIRFYPVDAKRENYKVFVYYADKTQEYDLKRARYEADGVIKLVGETTNFFDGVPVVCYYLGEEAQGIVEPVVPLIDDYDVLVSDSMNEFDRFSHAYLLLVKMSLTDQVKSSSPGVFKSALALLKQRRVFEQLPDKDAVSFLTKDIPTDYIRFMTELIRNQIHIQSHVPDLSSDAFKDGVSGVAIQRLMFDFENVVSNAEAEFDTALYERIRLITSIYDKTGRGNGGTFDEVTISHKRNAPLNLQEFADTALTMTQAGFSRYLVADIMPDDTVPDVEEELKRQEEDKEGMMPDVDAIPAPEDTEDTEDKDMDEEADNGDSGTASR